MDKLLRLIVATGWLHPVDREAYDRSRVDSATGCPTASDYRAVIRAAARHCNFCFCFFIDGMTDAYDLADAQFGITDDDGGLVDRRESFFICLLTVVIRPFYVVTPHRNGK